MESFVFGRIPVKNALDGKRIPTKLLIHEKINPDKEIIKTCERKGVTIQTVPADMLNKICNDKNHQGYLLYLSDFKYTDFDKVLNKVKDKQDSTILLLDGINDPVNFGSIIRSACFFNVDAIIIMKNRQVQMTPTVIKVSTGAEEFVPICQVTNLTNTIKELKKVGYFVVSSSDKGHDLFDEISYSGKIALVTGNEGKGVSRLVLENSDFIAKIPSTSTITSLNANVATACFLSYIESYRRKVNK